MYYLDELCWAFSEILQQGIILDKVSNVKKYWGCLFPFAISLQEMRYDLPNANISLQLYHLGHVRRKPDFQPDKAQTSLLCQKSRLELVK